MSGVNERLCTNECFKIGLPCRMGRKGKLSISFMVSAHSPPPTASTSFTYVQVSEKERGAAVVGQNRPALVQIKRSVPYCLGAHRLVCLLIMSEGCSSNECGKVLSGQWLPSPSTPSPCLYHWTTLNCLEATQDKGLVPLGCEGPVCDLCAPSGASIR